MIWLRLGFALLLTCTVGASEAAKDLLSLDVLRKRASAQPTVEWQATASSFQMPSAVPRNATVTCHVLRPDGPAPRRDDLVLYLQWPQEQIWTSDLWLRLARESGFTVCGLFFTGMDMEDDAYYTNKSDSYLWKESGSITALMDAVVEVRRRFGMPNRRLLVIGQSAGGTLAQHIAVDAPDIETGVALGGSAFLGRPSFRMPFLLINTRNDATVQSARGLAGLRAVMGEPLLNLECMPVWSKRGEPRENFEHCVNEGALRLALRYLEGVADLRRDQPSLPAAKNWPLAADPAKPSRVVSTADIAWRKTLAAPEPVMLPSAAAALAWLDLQQVVRQNAPTPGAVWASPAPTQTVSGIAVIDWRDDRGDSDVALVSAGLGEWDAMQAADAGMHGLWKAEATGKLGDLLNEAAKQNPALAKLPVQVLMFQPEPATLAAMAKCKGVAGIVVVYRTGTGAAKTAQMLEVVAQRGLAVDVLIFTSGQERDPLADALVEKQQVKVTLLDSTNRMLAWEHAQAMHFVIGQRARIAAPAKGTARARAP